MHKLTRFSANPGKLRFDIFVHLLRYIRCNKPLGLKYYSDMNDAPVSDMLSQASIKTENRLMDFSDSSSQDCPVTNRITGAYIILYQRSPIDHVTHATGPVSQSSVESEYNAACTAGMALPHFRVLLKRLFNKVPDIVQE